MKKASRKSYNRTEKNVDEVARGCEVRKIGESWILVPAADGLERDNVRKIVKLHDDHFL